MEKKYNILKIINPEKRAILFEQYKDCNFGELSIEYTAVFKNTKILRKIIYDFCNIFSIPNKWNTRIILIFEELCNNAIEHGSIEKDINICYISFLKQKDGIFMTGYVEDTGNKHDAKTYIEMKKIQNNFKNKDFSHHHSIRGRGLFLIVSQLVDTLDFKKSSLGGVRTCFEKFIPFD